jgi:hypothetical protein
MMEKIKKGSRGFERYRNLVGLPYHTLFKQQSLAALKYLINSRKKNCGSSACPLPIRMSTENIDSKTAASEQANLVQLGRVEGTNEKPRDEETERNETRKHERLGHKLTS